MSFAIGQRWISHADLELGLGICVEVDSRRITLLYPSAEEERTYATDRAPLTRYELKIGDRLSFIDAAGYTMVKKNWFNGVNMPAIAIKELDGSVKLVREFGFQDYLDSLS